MHTRLKASRGKDQATTGCRCLDHIDHTGPQIGDIVKTWMSDFCWTCLQTYLTCSIRCLAAVSSVSRALHGCTGKRKSVSKQIHAKVKRILRTLGFLVRLARRVQNRF